MPARRKTGSDAKPTVLDVARRAGVSLGTVSNVLNKPDEVSETRRARVRAAMAALGYVPNSVAQSLRRRQSRIVGLCVPYTTSAYFAALVEAFEEIGARQGYEIMQVLSRQDPALELRRVQALLGHRVAGLILLPSLDPRRSFDAVAESGVPAVVVDRLWDDRRFDYVTIDDRAAMRAATRLFTDIGHRRLLFIVAFPRLVTTRNRIEGFRQAARAAGASATVMERGDDEADFASRLAAILRGAARPTALIASNSTIMLWVLRALPVIGLRCPQELSLLVFDEPEWSDVVRPRLAIVRHPTAAIARTAWELLIGRIEGGAAPRRVLLDAALEPRESIAPPKRYDEAVGGPA